MPSRLTNRLLAGGSRRIPGLRRLPVFKLLALAEVALMTRDHLGRLDSSERGRLVALLREERGRSGNLAPQEREELAALVAKVEPRLLAGQAIDRLSPIPLPDRLVHGPRKR